MSLKHLTIGAAVAVCTFVAPAAAQKNELSGILGRLHQRSGHPRCALL